MVTLWWPEFPSHIDANSVIILMSLSQCASIFGSVSTFSSRRSFTRFPLAPFNLCLSVTLDWRLLTFYIFVWYCLSLRCWFQSVISFRFGDSFRGIVSNAVYVFLRSKAGFLENFATNIQYRTFLLTPYMPPAGGNSSLEWGVCIRFTVIRPQSDVTKTICHSVLDKLGVCFALKSFLNCSVHPGATSTGSLALCPLDLILI